MNQSTLQYIYHQFQTDQYYKRFFHNFQSREDRRQFQEHRSIKATITPHSVALSCGQTILMARIQTSIHEVTFNPIRQAYAEPLLSVSVNNSKLKGDKAIEAFLGKLIDWKAIETQLVRKNEETGRHFAQTGNVRVWVLGEDGSVVELALLAVQLLLWTTELADFTLQKGVKQQGLFRLDLPTFWFPFKCCEIIGQLLVDPTSGEEASSDFVVSVFANLLQQNSEPLVIQKCKGKLEGITADTMSCILGQSRASFQKVSLDLPGLRERRAEMTLSIY